jgi:hypothetical protein
MWILQIQWLVSSLSENMFLVEQHTSENEAVENELLDPPPPQLQVILDGINFSRFNQLYNNGNLA